MNKCDEATVNWQTNYRCTIINEMSADELELFEADIRDAIDGVLEDWGNK